MRYSRQREIILEIVKKSCSHPTAETIYENAKKEIPNISLGTVYRNLNQLVLNGDIVKFDAPDGLTRFDKTLETHMHIVCEYCNSVCDLEDLLKNIDFKIMNLTGYNNISHKISFSGICPECRKKKEGI